MRDQSDSGHRAPNVFEFIGDIARLARRAPLLVQALSQRRPAFTSHRNRDALNNANLFRALAQNLLNDPGTMLKAQAALWRDYRGLINYAGRRFLGEALESCVTPAPEDRRFADPAWENSGYFDLIKQAYLLTANWMVETAARVVGMSASDARKAVFYTRQGADAIAPTNFALSNPAVRRACIESNGENLIRGFDNVLTDLKRGDGKLRIRMVDEDAFEIGGNIANTPGQIVYQNDLMQLIQYAPTPNRSSSGHF